MDETIKIWFDRMIDSEMFKMEATLQGEIMVLKGDNCAAEDVKFQKEYIEDITRYLKILRKLKEGFSAYDLGILGDSEEECDG